MMDYIHLSATTPWSEPCAQVGSNHYMRNARMEARTYINQLIRTLGGNPIGSNFSMVHCPHDFGTYLDIKFFYDDEDQKHVIYMSQVESGCEKWDDISLALLEEGGYELEKDSEQLNNQHTEDFPDDELEEYSTYDSGPTGHGDECLSDADPEL